MNSDLILASRVSRQAVLYFSNVPKSIFGQLFYRMNSQMKLWV
jgi:hypothetical protein